MLYYAIFLPFEAGVYRLYIMGLTTTFLYVRKVEMIDMLMLRLAFTRRGSL